MIDLQALLSQALEVINAQQEWIDAVPSETVLPTMPGFDRDWSDTVVEEIEEALK